MSRRLQLVIDPPAPPAPVATAGVIQIGELRVNLADIAAQDDLIVSVRRAEPFDVYVGRRNPRFPNHSGIYGNPYLSPKDGSLAQVLMKHLVWFLSDPVVRARARKELRGKILACWCKPPGGFQQRWLCHAQTCAWWANSDRLAA